MPADCLVALAGFSNPFQRRGLPEVVLGCPRFRLAACSSSWLSGRCWFPVRVGGLLECQVDLLVDLEVVSDSVLSMFTLAMGVPDSVLLMFTLAMGVSDSVLSTFTLAMGTSDPVLSMFTLAMVPAHAAYIQCRWQDPPC